MVLRQPDSWSNWNLEMLVFEERGKPEYPEKNLSEQGREPTTNSTHIWRQRRDLNPGHTGGRRVLSPLRHPCSPAYICRRPWNRRWKIDFAAFQTESLLSQVAQFLKRRKFKLKLTGERGPRTSSDYASLLPCRFSSQVNLEFLISRGSFAKNSRAEFLFCLLNKEPY